MDFFGVLLTAGAAMSSGGYAVGVSVTLELGSPVGTFHAPDVVHGWKNISQIRYTFSENVFVDFYDLHLEAISPGGYNMSIYDFDYDPVHRTATWQVSGLPSIQNERYNIILSGVWRRSPFPEPVQPLTNAFTILTYDTDGNDTVSSRDNLLIINHINNGNPYDPMLDVNGDGSITPTDSLLIINFLDAYGPVPLVAPGPYAAVVKTPAPALSITNLTVQGGMVTMWMDGLPDGAMAVAEGTTDLIQPYWYPIASEPATGGVNRIEFPALGQGPVEFLRVGFQ